eukprot:CAMPEP_0184701146 /NCGR_PEP_ID=MMETSP0313-20130426/18337_1 /TAXON_ID=2792 /ORGANISM="Porphyridium aerugineum, Strain SAG 1380-2" /LENGTH=134 /DNA_ID=CAMNT_0027161097 /DNA_START=96 /DNA_END=496 /DNA_ORIENTATION=+
MQSTPTELIVPKSEKSTLVRTSVEFPPFNQTVNTVITNTSNTNASLTTNPDHELPIPTATGTPDTIHPNVADTNLQLGDRFIKASVNQASNINQSSIKVVADLAKGYALLDSRMETDNSVIRTATIVDDQNHST